MRQRFGLGLSETLTGNGGGQIDLAVPIKKEEEDEEL